MSDPDDDFALPKRRRKRAVRQVIDNTDTGTPDKKKPRKRVPKMKTPVLDSWLTSRSPPALQQQPSNSEPPKDYQCDRLWIDKYEPESKKELAVHTKKVDEVRAWIKSHLATVNPESSSILLLTGPSGAGKTATMRVLARELKFELIEWTNPVNENSIGSIADGISMYVPVLKPFEEFLGKSRRFSSLLFGDQLAETSRKVILIEDLPNLENRSVRIEFQSIITSWFERSHLCHYPIVFIMSDLPRYTSFSTDQFFPTPYSVFPPQLLRAFRTIHFNEVSNTLLTSLIKQIVSKENSSAKLSQPYISEIVSHANGDIRQTLNILQFGAIDRHFNNMESFDRSHGLAHFHTIGKVLYAKRTLSYPKGDVLPPLDFDVDEFINGLTMDADMLALSLVENLPAFTTEIDELFICLAGASTFDLMRPRILGNRTALQADIDRHVLVRQMLYDLGRYREKLPSGFKSLKKPEFFDYLKRERENRFYLSELRSSVGGEFLSCTADDTLLTYASFFTKIQPQSKLASLARRFNTLTTVRFQNFIRVTDEVNFDEDASEQTLPKLASTIDTKKVQETWWLADDIED